MEDFTIAPRHEDFFFVFYFFPWETFQFHGKTITILLLLFALFLIWPRYV
jgi:hypothetical protein